MDSSSPPMGNPNCLLYGQPGPPPSLLPVHAAPLHLLYEPTSGFVRRINLRDGEVLRGIYVAVRDRNRDTIAGALPETRCEIAADSFDIEFEGDVSQMEDQRNWTDREIRTCQTCTAASKPAPPD